MKNMLTAALAMASAFVGGLRMNSSSNSSSLQTIPSSWQNTGLARVEISAVKKLVRGRLVVGALMILPLAVCAAAAMANVVDLRKGGEIRGVIVAEEAERGRGMLEEQHANENRSKDSTMVNPARRPTVLVRTQCKETLEGVLVEQSWHLNSATTAAVETLAWLGFDVFVLMKTGEVEPRGRARQQNLSPPDEFDGVLSISATLRGEENERGVRTESVHGNIEFDSVLGRRKSKTFSGRAEATGRGRTDLGGGFYLGGGTSLHRDKVLFNANFGDVLASVVSSHLRVPKVQALFGVAVKDKASISYTFAYGRVAKESVKRFGSAADHKVPNLVYVHPGSAARYGLVRELFQGEDPRSVPYVVGLLRDGPTDKKTQELARALLIIVGSPAVKGLIALVQDESAPGRRSAIPVLGSIGHRSSVGPLIATLADDNKYVRSAAAYALSAIGDSRAVQPLVDMVQHGDDRHDRFAAAAALGKFRDVRALEPLISLVREVDLYPSDVGSVGDAFVGIGPRAVRPLIAALSELGQTRQLSRSCLRRALEKITGERGMKDAEAWQDWWKKEGRSFVNSKPVYVGKLVDSYHRAGCAVIERRQPKPVGLRKAKDQGMKPCPVCKPSP